ncbi:TetR/AcrR family transcriptional regulator [Spirochaeta cellobiosiphila]|uniref:TetR/AcrR family transcriptional regulator n=1 Tax=Spirochaeta cellobiosiphila TaxID=504483 RepID=UPI000406611F|nr:TetR/AcrR family transcriptional regulator [Spirochaeta cellobiosiphila]
MQIKKDKVYTNILDAARAEFLDKGFDGTSMRSLANKAGVSLSNIYNYFANKDDIFEQALHDVIHLLDKAMIAHNRGSHLTMDVYDNSEILKKQIRFFIHLIRRHQKELYILFFKSKGVARGDITQHYIEKMTVMGEEYIRLMSQKYGQVNGSVSLFFIHTYSAYWMSVIKELITHELSEDELEVFLTEAMEFSVAGWKRIMKV